MYGVVDRFEGEFAVIETDEGKILNIKKHLLPEEIREGDVINLENKTIDKEETNRRKSTVKDLVDELFN